MSREQKLSLIMGFALVLAVGIMISDHLAGTERGRSASPDVMAEASGAATAPAAWPTRRPMAPPAETGPDVAVVGADLSRGVAEALVQTRDTFGEWRRRLEDAPAAAETDAASPPAPPKIEMGVPPRARTDAPPAKDGSADGLRRYTVRKDDTLWGVAEAMYGDGSVWKPLAAYNADRIGKGNVLRPGATLLIPDRDALARGEVRTAEAKPAPTRRASQATGAARVYTVRKNDTLSQIAQRELGSAKRWREILDLNGDKLDRPEEIWVGMKLRLPSA